MVGWDVIDAGDLIRGYLVEGEAEFGKEQDKTFDSLTLNVCVHSLHFKSIAVSARANIP